MRLPAPQLAAALLSARLEYQARDRGRLLELLALGDEELVQAIGGKRRRELRARYARFTPEDIRWSDGRGGDLPPPPRLPARAGTGAAIGRRGCCTWRARHSDCKQLGAAADRGDRGEPQGDGLRHGDGAQPGARAGRERRDGGGRAWRTGSRWPRRRARSKSDGKTLTVMDGGLDVACPARRRALYGRLRRTGCAVAELPCGCGVQAAGATRRANGSWLGWRS